MKIAVISDLHIGACSAVDQFRHGEEAFLRFLDRLERRFDRIVLNGDVYQTDHGRRPGSQAEELHGARERYRRLVERFDRGPYLYIAGNHDHVAVAELGAPEVVDMDADGLRLHFTHGHLHDPFLQRHPRYGQFASWLAGWVERMGLRPLAEVLEWFDGYKHTPSPSDSPRGALVRAALARLDARISDVVVMGHTHRGTVLKTPAGHYLNSGTCSRSRLSWLEIDTAARRFLHRFEER